MEVEAAAWHTYRYDGLTIQLNKICLVKRDIRYLLYGNRRGSKMEPTFVSSESLLPTGGPIFDQHIDPTSAAEIFSFSGGLVVRKKFKRNGQGLG